MITRRESTFAYTRATCVGIPIRRTTVGEKEIWCPKTRAALICGRRRSGGSTRLWKRAVSADMDGLFPIRPPPRFCHRDRRVGGKVGLPDCRDQVVWGITVSHFNSVRADLGRMPRGFNVGKRIRRLHSSNCSFSGVYYPSLRRHGGAICQI